MRTESTHRADIDGLRAVAIIPVVCFHFGLALVVTSGGFVGVDIFFVISGYLITNSIVIDLERGTFSVQSFYKKRFRRIFPALFATYIGCIALSLLYSFPSEGDLIGKSIFSSIFFYSNIFFSHAAGYFNNETQFNPVIHTWSLSVEEQFYFIFPLFLLAVYKLDRRVLALSVIVVISIMGVISESLVRDNPVKGFYLIQGRAWELLIGSALSLNILPKVTSRKLAETLGLIGIIVLSFSIVFINNSFVFPGVWALPPCIGTALVIFSGKDNPTIVSRLLSVSPLRFIGTISYSLYLIHWPVIVFINSSFIPGRSLKLIILSITIIAAALMWRYVEQPFRRKPYWVSDRQMFPAVATAMAATAIATFGIQPAIQKIWHVPPLADQILSYERFDSTKMMRVGTCMLTSVDKIQQFLKSDCLKIDSTRKNVLLLGDSHAAHLLFGLSRVHPDTNFLLAAVGSCAPTEGGSKTTLCAEMMHYMLDSFVPNARLDAVVVAARWSEADVDIFKKTALKLVSEQPLVYVLGPIVEYDQPLPHLLAESLMKADNKLLDNHRRSEQYAIDSRMRDELVDTNVRYISLIRLICNTGCVSSVEKGVPLQFDYGHLTQSGSIWLAEHLGLVF
ncbi:MAG: acyltransferase family protein [Janthinobacterium lividum]